MFVRIFALWLIGTLLFIVAWTASYVVLPEGALRDAVISPELVSESPDAWATFGQLILVNLVLGMGSILFGNHFRIGTVPLGYVAPLFWAALYGIFLGTNSFGVSAGGKIAPTVAVLWTRSGALEITSYLVVAAATYRLVVWQKPSLFARTSEKIRRIRDIPLDRTEIALLVLGFVLLGIANWREAVDILGTLV
ncbi:hypothetical protein ACFQH6_12120 [Halobacteriaceae archaeon GCM10025711]